MNNVTIFGVFNSMEWIEYLIVILYIITNTKKTSLKNQLENMYQDFYANNDIILEV